MKLSELMAAHTPSPTFEGFVTNDDFVLAIDCSAEGSAEVKDYAVAQLGVTGLDANHCSNLDGCASSSSSGKNSAEYMSAFTPDTIDEAKFTTPRISGHLATPVRFLSGSTFVTRPSGPRTTMERLSGPCIMMPSIRA